MTDEKVILSYNVTAGFEPLLIDIELLELSERKFVLSGTTHDALKQIPEASGFRVPVSARWVRQLLADLKAAKIPAFPDPVYGCDGSFTTLQIGDSYTGVTYRWWAAPQGWEPLKELTTRIERRFFSGMTNLQKEGQAD